MPEDRDAETWGQPFDSPDPEKLTPISTGTLIDVPEEIESHFYQVPSHIWSELMALLEAEKKLYWREVLWDERTEVAANWRKWNQGDILLLDPPFEIRMKDYQPLLITPSDYIELENWLLKNPLPKERKRDNSDASELMTLLQCSYLLQSKRGNTEWLLVFNAMKKCSLPGERFEPPRSLVPTARLELYFEDNDSPQTLKLSTFQKYLSQYRTGKKKLLLPSKNKVIPYRVSIWLSIPQQCGFTPNVQTESHMHQDLSPQFLNELSAANYLGVSVKNLQRWRFERRGPAYSKVGGKIVRYSIEDLNHFFEQSRVDHKD